MKQGFGPAAALFAGVLVVTGGLGWVLYEAGKPAAPEDPESAPGEHPDKHAVPRQHSAEPPVDMSIPPNLRKQHLPPDSGPRFDLPGHEDLKNRNWKDVAAALEEMRANSLDLLEKGVARPDDGDRFDTMRHRMEHFLTAAVNRPPGPDLALKATQVDHPAFAVNAIAAVLERSKLPLTEAQARRLFDLAKEHGPQIDEADAALLKEDASAWLLERFAARANLLSTFYAEAFAVLTPAQGVAVSPEEFRGRLRLDILSATGSWGRLGLPLAFSDDKKLIELITNGLGSQFKLLERADELRQIVEAWVRSGGFDAADLFDRKGFIRSSHVAAAVPRMVELLQRIVDGMQLPPEVAEAVRQVPQAYVPLRQ